MNKNIRLGFMASGSGSSIENIITRINQGYLIGFESGVILCNKYEDKAGIYQRAKRLKVPIFYAQGTEEQIEILKNYDVDLILGLGYTKIVGKSLLNEFENKILNIHPTLLPLHGGKGMYGLATHLSVLKSNDKYTGVTIHSMNHEFDKGNILRQIKIPIPKHLIGESTDDNAKELQKYVLNEEYELMPHVLEKIRDNEIIL